MKAGNREHPSVDDLAALVSTGGHASDPHVSSCEMCQEVALLLRDAGVTSIPFRGEVLPPPGPCLSEDQLCAVAAGTLSERESFALLDHVSSCERCAPRLQGMLAGLAEGSEEDTAEEVARLKSATPFWQHNAVAKLLPDRRRRWGALAVAAAAIAVMSLPVGWMVVHRLDPPAETYLARAYTEQRPFDLRLPDQGHAAVAQRMGPGSQTRPKSLVQAEAKLAGEDAAGDTRALALRGRAELLAWRYDAAIATLEQARTADPSTPGLLDLSTAYVLRGDAERRADDYGRALDVLGRFLKAHPDSREGHFNRGLIFGRMNLVDDAVAAWEDYLKLDGSGSWADEARKHRDALAEKKTSGSAR